MKNDPGCHLPHQIVLGQPVLVPHLKEHLVPHRVQLKEYLISALETLRTHRKEKSAGELLKDGVPVALGHLRLLLVLVQDHLGGLLTAEDDSIAPEMTLLGKDKNLFKSICFCCVSFAL